MIKRTSSRGVTVLEFALAVPVLLTFALGIISAARIFEVKSALNQSVSLALRCVATTDGNCKDLSASAPVPLYNWYRTNSTVLYDIDQYSYSGLLKWIDQPRYRYHPEARILGAATSDYSQTGYQSRAIEYAVTGRTPFILETARAPHFQGPNAFHATTVYQGERGTEYPPTLDSDLSSIQLSDGLANPDTQGSVTFSIPNPFSAEERQATVCIRSTAHNTASGPFEVPANATDVCESNYANRAQIVLYVTGHSGGDGGIGMQLTWPGGSRNLGGRTFSGPGWGSFVPRGVPDSSYVDNNTLNSITHGTPYAEWGLYRNLSVPYDTPITLRFNLGAQAGHSATWQGESAKIYLVKYQGRWHEESCSNIQPSQLAQHPGEQERSSYLAQHCGNLTVAHYMHSGQDTLRSSAATSGSVDTSHNASSAQPVALGCLLNQNEANSVAAQQHGTSVDYEISQISGSQCDNLSVEHNCPGFGDRIDAAHGRNYGVPELADPDGIITQSTSASQICPAASNERTQAYGAVPTSTRWREQVYSVPDEAIGPDGLTWTRTDCAVNSPVLPSPLTLVPENKLTLGTPESLGAVPQFTGGQDPVVTMTSDPTRYDCMSVGERVLNDAGSLFSGSQVDLGESCWISQLRAEALRLGANGQEFMLFGRVKLAPLAVETVPTLSCGAGAHAHFGYPGEETLLAQNLPAGQTPPECNGATAICRHELSHFSGGNPSSGTTNIEKAQDFAFRELQSVYGSARRCAGMGQGSLPSDCADIVVNERLAAGKKLYDVVAQAEVKLPFNQRVRLVSTGTRSAEENFAR